MKHNSERKQCLQRKITHELQRYFIYAIFLSLMLSAVLTSRRLILEKYSLSVPHYGYAIIEAFILAKIIIIGENLGFDNKFRNKPLIIPVIYKTIIFSMLVIVFSIVEHFVIGLFNKNDIGMLYDQLFENGINISLANGLNMICMFVLLFSFLEIARILGENKLIKLFFIRPQLSRSTVSK